MTADQVLPARNPAHLLLVVIVTHNVPSALEPVLRAVTGQADPAAVVLLFTGGPGSPRRAAARQAATRNGIRLLETPRPCRIGTARDWIVSYLATSPGLGWPGGALAFLDDDCAPRPGWRQAAEDAIRGGAALAFGPRYPATIHGLGATIRTAESRKSRKLTGAQAASRLTAPRMLVAGGNMVTSRWCAHAYGITDPLFADGAFEDVDYQLRLQAAGEKVEFCPALAVDHHDVLGSRELLRKSVLSGAGMARCAARHGRSFWACCRWRPCRALGRRITVLLLAAPAATASLGLSAPARLAVTAAIVTVLAALLTAATSREQTAAMILRWLRDTVLAVSYLAVTAHRALLPGRDALVHVFRGRRHRGLDAPPLPRQRRGRG